MIPRGDTLPETLDAVCRLVEEVANGAVASILLLDRDGLHLRHGAAPSLPKSYTDAIDGAAIGPAAGSFGTAAYRKEPVIVTDIARDSLWVAYKDLALLHGLLACWSTPVFASDGGVLGTFAIYSREPRGPTDVEWRVIDQIAHLARTAIERTRAEEQRQARLWFLERMDEVNRAIQRANDLEQMMGDVLDITLTLLDCDRAWLVYPCDPAAPSHGVKMQRTRAEFPGRYDVGVEVPMDEDTADVFRIARAAKGPVRFDPASAHPMPPAMSERLGSLSGLAMAIYPKGDQPYLFGVSQCSSARVWAEREEQLVRGIGQRMTDALTGLLMFRTLRQSERKLEQAQRISHVGHWEGDLVTEHFMYSDETYRILGLPSDGRGRTFQEIQALVHPADRSRRAAVMENARRGVPYDLEYRVIQPSGEMRFVRTQGDVMNDESGRPRYLFGIIQDITEQKRAEQRLVVQASVTRILAEAATLQEATRQILQTVCEILDWDLGALWRVDRDADVLRCVETWHRDSFPAPHFVAVSRAGTFTRGSGSPGRVWAGREPVYIPDVTQDANFPRAPVAIREGLHTAVTFPILLAGDVVGTIEFFSREILPRDDEMMHTLAILGSQIGQFIERKRAEDALRASEASLAEGQQMSHTGSWRWNARSREVHESAELIRIFGWDPSAGPRTHRDYIESVHPDDRPMVEQILDRCVRVERCAYEYECRIVRPDGVVRYLHLVGRPTTDASGQLEFVGSTQDITDLKQAERRIVAQYTVAQALTEAATLEDAAPKILRAICECLEWDVGGLWRLDPTTELMRCVDVWHKPSLEVSEFEAATRALTFKPGIGTPGRVWVAHGPVHVPDVSRDPYVQLGPYTPRAPAAVRAGLHSGFGVPILLGELVVGAIEFYSHEIREPDHELLKVMAAVGIQVGQFIERTQAEEALRRAQGELAHVTRVATLGELTASIAHEINQPLGAVVNNASACVRWLAAQNLEEARRSATLVIADGHRAAQIISRMRALAANAPPQNDRFDLNATIQEVIDLARSELHRHGVVLETHLAEGLSPIRGDRVQLQQVLLNLVMNALEAMSTGGQWPRVLVVSTERTAAPGVVVAVRDSGPGFDSQQAGRLFDAFYTTKANGLGLGLAISRRIVEAHGGQLWATANTPRGAVFQFTVRAGETQKS